MAQTITSVIQNTLALTTSDTWTVSDSHDPGGRSVTLGTLATSTYWRPYLATTGTPGTPSTTRTSPKSLLAHVANRVNAGAGGTLWTFAVTSGGFITATYSGTGTGTLAVGAGPVARVLGLPTSTVSVGFTAGQTQTMSYHPTHTAYFVSRPNDTNWQDDPPLCAVSEPRDGSTVVIQDATAVLTRTFDARFHPYDWTARSTLGITSGQASATPIRGDSSRRKTRSALAGVTPPWGWDDMIYAAPQNGGLCAAVLGDFASYVSGSLTSYDVVTFAAETLTRRAPTKPTAANWQPALDIERVALRWYSTGSF